MVSAANPANITLRQILESENLCEFLGVHDALSAIIAEREGFSGLWISGFGMSAVNGIRDANEQSWTEIIEQVERICDQTSIPAIVDGDTGHGDFNIARRFAWKLHRAGAKGVCLEDKNFPKRNSFAEGLSESMTDIEEFCGKLKACRDKVSESDFVIVARTENLILGNSIEETLSRCERYVAAGAEAILLHSKANNADELRLFVAGWNNLAPLICIPTKYPKVSKAEIQKLGFKIAIWANQLLRASVSSMKNACQSIKGSSNFEMNYGPIATMEDIFDLQKMDELKVSLKQYTSPSPK
jgi:phosphoenolpyruvate phosphomutase